MHENLKPWKVCITPRGTYSSNVQYYALDLVTYQGSGYLVKEDCMGVIPVEGDYYQLLASKGNDGSDTKGSKRSSECPNCFWYPDLQ